MDEWQENNNTHGNDASFLNEGELNLNTYKIQVHLSKTSLRLDPEVKGHKVSFALKHGSSFSSLQSAA